MGTICGMHVKTEIHKDFSQIRTVALSRGLLHAAMSREIPPCETNFEIGGEE